MQEFDSCYSHVRAQLSTQLSAMAKPSPVHCGHLACEPGIGSLLLLITQANFKAKTETFGYTISIWLCSLLITSLEVQGLWGPLGIWPGSPFPALIFSVSLAQLLNPSFSTAIPLQKLQHGTGLPCHQVQIVESPQCQPGRLNGELPPAPVRGCQACMLRCVPRVTLGPLSAAPNDLGAISIKVVLLPGSECSLPVRVDRSWVKASGILFPHSMDVE